MRLFRKTSTYLLVTLMLTGCGGSSSDNTAITPISISSTAPTTAIEDNLYSYQVTTLNGNAPTFTINNAPDGMNISNTGLITWVPLEGVITSGEITVTATSANKTTESQTFTITVQAINDQLQLVSEPENHSIDSGTAFSHQIQVIDVDDENNGQDISFELVSAPSGMTVSSTGLIEWQAEVNQSSNFAIDVAINDGGEDATETIHFTFSMDVLFYQKITGRVVNYHTGEPLNNADLSLYTTETTIESHSTSNDTGFFEVSILDTLAENKMTLFADAIGYGEHSVIVDSSSILQTQHIALLPNHVTTSFNSNIASTITYQGETLVDFPAASLVREDGQPIDGQVTAELTIIDPSLDINLMPGDMLTMTNQGLTPIESFGAMTVALVDESGANINIADNQLVKIRIPFASISDNAPNTIPLYYFDEKEGLWIEEGEANKVIVNGESYYEGQVSHFTTWNADRVYETVYIHGCVVDVNNTVISNAKMISKGRDYNGSAATFTDENGQFSLAVKTYSTVLVSGSQGSQSRTLSQIVLNEDITIEECIILSPATSTVKLTWGENPRDLDTHFYGPANEIGDDRFHISYSNKEEVLNNSTIYLDVDDTRSYGPEILTIPAFPYAGRYQYVIREYAGSGDILSSPTRVELNLESQIRIFSPPQGVVTDYWHVFDFVVSDTGEVIIEPVNTWLDNLPSTNSAPTVSTNNIGEARKNTLLKQAIKKKYYKDN
ncbi:hypothetical protein GCM10009111_32180 [Colwellia asteriadis]|uniref:Dystroglycan-type cadherin-like domain-containing protein n=1 Tax=Colwellia asteriadis TaxID=517723 RepID=A0ABN1LB73_9GAMM